MTAALCVTVIAIHALGLGETFELARSFVPDQPWRVVTGHLVHWNESHLFWDLVVFAALGAALERHSRGRLALGLALSGVAVSVAFLLGAPGLQSYRGLSGVDSALFVGLLVALGRRAAAERHRPMLGCVIVAGAGFLAKVGYEVVTGNTLFAESHDFVPLASAHAVGALSGLLVWGAPLVSPRSGSARSRTAPRCHRAT